MTMEVKPTQQARAIAISAWAAAISGGTISMIDRGTELVNMPVTASVVGGELIAEGSWSTIRMRGRPDSWLIRSANGVVLFEGPFTDGSVVSDVGGEPGVLIPGGRAHITVAVTI
jgi:hypothetical protein